jgi:predicted ribosomally synthesized peptide with nif11-like leader
VPASDALAFIAKVGQSPELQDRLSRMRGRDALDQLVDVGREIGYQFSVEEYREAVVSLAEGELSDESLDQVLRETGLK